MITSFTTFQSLLNATATSLDAPAQDATAPGAGILQNGHKAFGSEASQRAARRLRRVRQRMGAYRHDLLVALRVVNTVEREMVQSEWEGWLAGETRRCELAKEMLARYDGERGAGGGQGGGYERRVKEQVPLRAGEEGEEAADGQNKKTRVEELRQWVDEYCSSCAAEERKVLERRTLAGL